MAKLPGPTMIGQSRCHPSCAWDTVEEQTLVSHMNRMPGGPWISGFLGSSTAEILSRFGVSFLGNFLVIDAAITQTVAPDLTCLMGPIDSRIGYDPSVMTTQDIEDCYQREHG
ncbi:hypothetical protein LX36DRAFT_668422 [Colletotrichum falcatum]|nr:hypothetical protein LX36DRAFT_668422 [Colletotrichum falcatum]